MNGPDPYFNEQNQAYKLGELDFEKVVPRQCSCGHCAYCDGFDDAEYDIVMSREDMGDEYCAFDKE